MYFTAACKNVQRCHSAQFIKENLKGDLTAVYEHFQREKNMGFYRSLAQKGLIQLHSWKPKPEKFKELLGKTYQEK